MSVKGTVIVKDLTKGEIHSMMLKEEDRKTFVDYISVEDVSSKALSVIDIAVDGSGYMCHVTRKNGQQVLVDIDKRDTIGFLPVVKKDGRLMSADEFNNPFKYIMNMMKSGNDISSLYAEFGEGLFSMKI